MKKEIIAIIACFVCGGCANQQKQEAVNNAILGQQSNIANGVFNHELTESEISSFSKSIALIKYQERQDILSNGHGLTSRQKNQLMRELFYLSKQIDRTRNGTAVIRLN